MLRYGGTKGRAYAMNNATEYFAEGTEAYFGTNDFYPFVRPELEEHDPEMARLVKKLWCGGIAAARHFTAQTLRRRSRRATQPSEPSCPGTSQSSQYS